MMLKKEENTSNTPISFTKFVDADKKTAKTYDVVQGELCKSPMGNFWNGSFEAISLLADQLPAFIEAMTAGEFIVQGLHESLTFGQCPKDATRAKDLFSFSAQAGLLVIDSDSLHKFDGIATLPELIGALHQIEPALAPSMAFCSSSASSYIAYKDTQYGLRGVHTFIPINQTLFNGEILERCHVRSVLAGFAYPAITKDGKILIKSLIDTALKTANQPIFEGGALLLNADIHQDRQFYCHSGNLLDSQAIKPITKNEQLRFDAIIKSLKESVVGEAETIKNDYIDTKAKEIKDKTVNLSQRHSIYVVGKAIEGHLYGHFTLTLDNHQVITIQDILNDKDKYHGVGCAHPLDDELFGKSIIYSNQAHPIIHSFANGGQVYYLEPTQAEWEINLHQHIESFNETHAQVMIGGKHRIMRQVPEHIHSDNRITYDFFAEKELQKMYANDLIQVAENKTGQQTRPIYKDKITAWSKHQHCKKYTGGVVFAPNKTPNTDYYNTWQGFAIESLEGADTTLITQHLEQIICANQPALIEYLYNWIAYTVQNPDKPAGAAPVLYGDKGVGKGLFGHFLCKIWGSHAIHMSNPRHLVGNFNGHLADTCFLFADEAFFAGDKKSEGILKALITEPTLIIERKGVDAIAQPNYLKVLMATNNEFAVPASKDERRYCVLDVSNSRVGDKSYFDALNKAIKDKAVQASFLYDMLNRDISQFSVSAIPESRGLKTQRLNSLNSMGKWLVDSLSAGSLTATYDHLPAEWVDELSTKTLYESYKDWATVNRIGNYEFATQNALGRYLKKIYPDKKLKGDVRGYVLGSLRCAIEQFECYEKVDLEINDTRC